MLIINMGSSSRLSRTEHRLFLQPLKFSPSHFWVFVKWAQWNLPTIKVTLRVKQIKVLNVLITEAIVNTQPVLQYGQFSLFIS